MFRRGEKTPNANLLVDKDGLLRQAALPSSLESGYVEKSKAFTVWVLALVGVFIGVTAPFALVMGIGELRAQKDGRRDPDVGQPCTQGYKSPFAWHARGQGFKSPQLHF